MNVLRAITTLPKLLVDAGLLQSDANELKADPDVQAELKNCPILTARLQQISAEWRAVENDIDAIRK